LREYLDDCIVVYLDDIFIYSKNEKEHTGHVIKVLEALEKTKLKINREKLTFHQMKVEFLRYILTTTGVKMNSEKVKAVLNWSILITVKEVQKCMRFANFYRKFIRGYSGILALITDLIKKDESFNWTKNQQFVFDELKKRFLEALILTIFNPEKPITLKINASDYAIGACII
jgi:RNase H-like domain found in reverse transcriptase/Reverse transcriptase (RNA-dependent DNA polymerase)